MPTFRVTAPDGQTYNVTPPDGMNPSEAEILAQVQQHAGASAPAPASPQRTGIGQAYQDVRSAGGRLINFLNDPTGSFEGARKALQQPPASEQYNPLPSNLTTGLSSTAVGLAPGGSGVMGALS